MGYSAVAIPDILRENSGKAEYNKKRLAAGRSSETHGKGEGAGVKIIHSSVMVMKIMNYLFGGETLYNCRPGPPAKDGKNVGTVTTNKVKQSTFTVHRIENLNICHWSGLLKYNTRIITGLPQYNRS